MKHKFGTSHHHTWGKVDDVRLRRVDGIKRRWSSHDVYYHVLDHFMGPVITAESTQIQAAIQQHLRVIQDYPI